MTFFCPEHIPKWWIETPDGTIIPIPEGASPLVTLCDMNDEAPPRSVLSFNDDDDLWITTITETGEGDSLEDALPLVFARHNWHDSPMGGGW